MSPFTARAFLLLLFVTPGVTVQQDAGCKAGSCEDTVSLLQNELLKSVHRSKPSAKRADACQCLNWKETFAAGLVECGQGFEFTRALGYPQATYGTAEEWLQHVQNKDTLHTLQGYFNAEFCESFYKRFDDTKCARTAMDSSPTEWYGKSWCYVSKECSSAMAVADAQVSVKLCEAGKDSQLSDMDPVDLMAYGQKMGFYVPGYFVKVSYPVDRSFFYDTASTTDLLRTKMGGQIVLVDKIDEHQDKMIVVGSKVYDLAGGYDSFKCYEGCSDEVWSFAMGKDRSKCAQGGKDNVKAFFEHGQHEGFLVDRELWTSPCREHGYDFGHTKIMDH